MTDDIVTRLREGEKWHRNGYVEVPSGFYEFLANEIERERKTADDEIERLQRACDYYQKMCSMIADKNFTANEDIERLRNEVEYLNQVADQLEEQVAFWITEAHKKKKWWCNRRG